MFRLGAGIRRSSYGNCRVSNLKTLLSILIVAMVLVTSVTCASAAAPATIAATLDNRVVHVTGEGFSSVSVIQLSFMYQVPKQVTLNATSAGTFEFDERFPKVSQVC